MFDDESTRYTSLRGGGQVDTKVRGKVFGRVDYI